MTTLVGTPKQIEFATAIMAGLATSAKAILAVDINSFERGSRPAMVVFYQQGTAKKAANTAAILAAILANDFDTASVLSEKDYLGDIEEMMDVNQNVHAGRVIDALKNTYYTLQNAVAELPAPPVKKTTRFTFTAELNRAAWAIRRQAAAKYGCKASEISWKECLRMARNGETI